MALLEDSLVRARGGSPQIVAVEGVAGIGKTSLVRHFVAHEDPSTVFWCSGDLDEVSLPWGLLTQLGEAAQAKGAPGLADLVKELSPDTDPLLVGANLVRLVKEDELAVVVLDDIQWADQQSLAAARFAFRRLTPGQVQVVMTYRPEEAARLGEGWRRLLVEKGSRVRLAGLNVPELVELSEAVTGTRLSRRAATKLFEQTSGHPLYARSLLEQLPQSIFERADGPLPPPVDLATTVSSRLASCSSAAQDVVRLASVLGSTCSVVDLRSAASAMDFADALGEAMEAGLLGEVPGSNGREVSFPHLLVRSAVYQALRPRERRELHAAAALGLVGRAALQHRAAAFTAPDSDLADEAERYAFEDIAAGRLRRGAIELKMALSLTPKGPARRPRLLAAAEALLVSGDVPAAAALVKELNGFPADPWLRYIEGYLALLQGHVADAEALLSGARATLQSGGPADGAPGDLVVRVAALLAIIAVVQLDYPAMVRFGEEAAQGDASQDWVGALAWFSKLLGLALAGRAPEALTLLEPLNQPDGPKGLEALVARGIVRLWTDDLAGAHADLTSAAEKADAGRPLGVSQAIGFLGHAAFRLGRLDDAVEHGELAVTMAFEADRVWELPMLHAFAALSRAARGDLAEADNHVTAAAQWAELMSTRSARAFASGARAHLAQARDDTGALYKAAVDFTAACDSVEPGVHLLGPVLAQALVALGRLDEAGTALKQFELLVVASGRRSASASVARVKGQLAAARGDWGGAEALFASAVRISDELAMPLASGLAHMAWGTGALRAGKRKTAGRELAIARHIFEGAGAKAYAALADRSLEKLGMSRDAGIPLGPRLLTPTEDAVARLATSGASNAEIARRLAVSVKGVEYHLTHIYAKFGISSRRELAVKMRAMDARRPGQAAGT
jgi:DNA-binding CsgD family transcriptional regulator